MADDDFRFQIEFYDKADADFIAGELKDKDAPQQVRDALGEHVIITHDEAVLFGYTASEAAAQSAAKVISSLAAQHGLKASLRPIERWHPIEKQWESASAPLPETEAEVSAEHEKWEQREAADSLEDNLAEWQLRIELGSHEDAVELAEKLEGEGVSPLVRRWKYLLIGAANEDLARQLERRLEAEYPSAGDIKVEPAPAEMYENSGGLLNALATEFGGLPLYWRHD